ncbi:MAG: hypothetical protein ACJ735_05190 [Actinomycetes bacterium]
MGGKKRTWFGAVAAATVAATVAFVTGATTANAAGLASYSTSATPSTVIAGSTNPFTFTFTNTGSPVAGVLTLGSVLITPPSGFTASGPFIASSSNGSTWSAAQSGGSVCLSGGTALAPGDSATLTLKATAGSSSGQWATSGYVANDCSSVLGTFPYSPDDQPMTQVDTLAWGQQPQDGSKIGVKLSPAPTVQALNGSTVDTSFTGPVTVSLNPSSGGLTGTTTVNAVNGVAAFSNIAIGTAGHYTLTPSSGGGTGPASRGFDVGTSGSSTPCPAAQGCTSPVLATTSGTVETEGKVTADPAVPADVLNVTLGGLPPVCTNQITATLSFTVPTRTATVQIAYDQDRDSDYLHGTPGKTTNIYNYAIAANTYQVCWQSDQAFKDASGNTVTNGILPTCVASASVRPCVQAEWAEVESIDKRGNPVVDTHEIEADVLAPAGDPGGGIRGLLT